MNHDLASAWISPLVYYGARLLASSITQITALYLPPQGDGDSGSPPPRPWCLPPKLLGFWYIWTHTVEKITRIRFTPPHIMRAVLAYTVERVKEEGGRHCFCKLATEISAPGYPTSAVYAETKLATVTGIPQCTSKRTPMAAVTIRRNSALLRRVTGRFYL